MRLEHKYHDNVHQSTSYGLLLSFEYVSGSSFKCFYSITIALTLWSRENPEKLQKSEEAV